MGALSSSTVCVCVSQRVSRQRSARNGGKPATRWITWQTSSTRSHSGPPETFLSGCTNASGEVCFGRCLCTCMCHSDLMGIPLHPFISHPGCSVCIVTASWRVTPCGTWWWSTCWPGSSSPLCPTCFSSTTAWPTRPSPCSTCCSPSARWPRSTGTLPENNYSTERTFCSFLGHLRYKFRLKECNSVCFY